MLQDQYWCKFHCRVCLNFVYLNFASFFLRRGSPPGNREASPDDPLPAAGRYVAPYHSPDGSTDHNPYHSALKDTEMSTANPNPKP